MPLRQIEETYTLSEVSLQAWASQEKVHQMDQRMNKTTEDAPRPVAKVSTMKAGIEKVLGRSVDETLVDAKGSFSLKSLKGEDVAKVFAAMGLPIGITN